MIQTKVYTEEEVNALRKTYKIVQELIEKAQKEIDACEQEIERQTCELGKEYLEECGTVLGSLLETIYLAEEMGKTTEKEEKVSCCGCCNYCCRCN